MHFNEIEIGKVYRADVTKSIKGTGIDIVTRLSGMGLPGFWMSEPLLFRMTVFPPRWKCEAGMNGNGEDSLPDAGRSKTRKKNLSPKGSTPDCSPDNNHLYDD